MAPKKKAAVPQSPRDRPPRKGEHVPFSGEAHKLFEKWAKGNVSGGIVKRQLTDMIRDLARTNKLRFSSDRALVKWVDEEFKKYDINSDHKLSLEEFLDFFGRWLDKSADEAWEQHEKTLSQVENLFISLDFNRDFSLNREEVRNFIIDKTPQGLRVPPLDQLDSLINETFGRYDTDKSGTLSLSEFEEAYNALIDGINALHKQRRSELIAESGFAQTVRSSRASGCTSEADEEDLKEQAKGRFDGPVWVVPELELTAAVKRALEKKKIPLLFAEPPGSIDMPSEILFKSRGGLNTKVLNVQELIARQCETRMSDEEVCGEVRDVALECMDDGKLFVMRLGHSVPDFMFTWNKKGVLPIDWLDPEMMVPGRLPPELQPMAASSGQGDKQIAHGYFVAVTSCMHMDNFKDVLRAKLPLHNMQPIQVLPGWVEVVETLLFGLRVLNLDDELDEMDRLADLL